MIVILFCLPWLHNLSYMFSETQWVKNVPHLSFYPSKHRRSVYCIFSNPNRQHQKFHYSWHHERSSCSETLYLRYTTQCITLLGSFMMNNYFLGIVKYNDLLINFYLLAKTSPIWIFSVLTRFQSVQ